MQPLMRFSKCLSLCIVAVFGVLPALADIHVYFGNLHAHSAASDGNETISPARAYQIAREEGHMDFLSLSEHNHLMDSQQTYDEVIAAASAATNNGFVALYGQEYSTIKKGFNHTNIQNYPVRIPPTMNGKYGAVFGTILPAYVTSHPDTVLFAEFNHPDKIDNDYGMKSDFEGDFDKFVATMDDFVRLIAVASGPADASAKDFVPTGRQRFMHQNISTGRWFEYLAHGMHLAPKMDHDTHSPTYGFRHAGRTAVWVDGDFNQRSLLTALAARHCYATEDMNLRIVPTLAHNRLPGDIITGAGDGDVSVTLAIADDDEANATYKIEVFGGVIGSGSIATKRSDLNATQTGNGSVQLNLKAEADTSIYYVIHVEQSSTDPVNGSTIDDAWLAPIWLDGTVAVTSSGTVNDDEPAHRFVSSRNSKTTYHYPECRVAREIIKNHNDVWHDSEPSGMTLHKGCPWD